MKCIVYSCSNIGSNENIKTHLIYTRLYCTKHNLKYKHIFVDNYKFKKFLKYNVFDDFINSKYDKMLYVDWDVIISPGTDNIFKSLAGCKFGARCFPHFKNSGEEDYNQYYDKFKAAFNIEASFELENYFNSGIILTDRETVNLLLPEMYEMSNKIDKEYGDKIVNSEMYIREEFLTNYIVQKNNINITPLDTKWHMSYRNINARGNEFVHFNCKEQSDKHMFIKNYIDSHPHIFKYNIQ